MGKGFALPGLGVDTIYIVGAGGIGCAIGYALAAGGHRPIFVEADAAKLAVARAGGVVVDKLPPLSAEFIGFDQWQPSPGALVLLCTKCYDNATVLARLPSSITLLPIQNGFDPALHAHGHALEGVASFVSERLRDRPHTRITRAGRLHLGYRQAGGEEPAASRWLALLVETLAHARARVRQLCRIRVEAVANILPYKYSKLMYNSAISPLAAAAGLDNGDLLWIRSARRLFFALLRENYSILHGAGIELGRIGPFHPTTVNRILHRPTLANSLAWAFYPTLRGSYCSMSGDLPRGQTEIDYYNGHLITVAGDRPCPLNRRVYEMIQHMQQERRPPSLQALAEWLPG